MASRDTKLKIIVDAENRSQAALKGVTSQLDGVKKSYEGVQSAMKTVGKVGVVALGGLSLLTKEIVEAGVGFEQTQIAFETMLGSAEQARKTLADLAQFAARTPFELGQLEEAAKRLLAYGTTADELIPTLQMLGDMAAGVGMDKLPQLILAFGQVRAATKLTGAELRQFSEAGIPLLGALATHLGETEAEIIEMVSEGAIGFETMKAALSGMTAEGGKFHNLMAQQSQSLGGLWSTLKDNISLTARAIGQELLPYLKPLVEQLIALTQRVGEFVKEHPKLSAFLLAAALGLAALTAILLPLAVALPGLILMFQGFGAILALVASGPGIAIVAAIVAIGATLVYLTKEGYLTQQAWQDVWLGIKLMAAGTANAVIGIVEGMVNFIIDGVNFAIRALNKVITLAQKIPGFGRKIATIDEIERASFNQFDSDLIASSDLQGRSGAGTVQPIINITGNTLLDEEAAVTIGDMLMSRFKLSSMI